MTAIDDVRARGRAVAILAVAMCQGCLSIAPYAGSDAGSDAGTSNFEQSNSDFRNSDTLTVGFKNPVATGDLVIVVVGTYTGALMGVTDSASNHYVEAGVAVTTPAGSTMRIFYAANVTTAASLAVTAAAAAGTSELTVAIHAYRGVALDPLDQIAPPSTGTGTEPTSGSVTTTASSELYFAAMSHDASPRTGAGPNYTLREVATDSASNVPIATEDKIGPAQATLATFTLDSSEGWACSLLTFKLSPPGS